MTLIHEKGTSMGIILSVAAVASLFQAVLYNSECCIADTWIDTNMYFMTFALKLYGLLDYIHSEVKHSTQRPQLFRIMRIVPKIDR